MWLRPLVRYFLRGAFVTAPLALTLYIILKLLSFIDQVLPIGIPGLGLLVTLALITLIGFLTSNVVGRGILEGTERLLRRVPLVKLIYGSIKDLVGAFVGDRKSFDRPVAIRPYGGADARMLGFITREDLLALGMPGYLGVETARGADGFGITVCCWQDEASIRGWKAQAEHHAAQERGKAEWYERYELKVAKVERAYGFKR